MIYYVIIYLIILYQSVFTWL